MGNMKSGEACWVDAQALHTEDPRSFWAPTEEELKSLRPGDFVKIVAANSSERFWCEVKDIVGSGRIRCMILPEFSTPSENTGNHSKPNLLVEVEMLNVCDIKKKNRRLSLMALNHDNFRAEAVKVVHESEASLGKIDTGDYSAIQALYKKGKISEEELASVISNVDKPRLPTIEECHSQDSACGRESNQHLEESYRLRVLYDVVALFIRFEGRSPTQAEITDLSLEVKETLCESRLEEVSEKSMETVLKELSIFSSDPFENRLNKWLLLEVQELQLAKKSQFGLKLKSDVAASGDVKMEVHEPFASIKINDERASSL